MVKVGISDSTGVKVFSPPPPSLQENESSTLQDEQNRSGVIHAGITDGSGRVPSPFAPTNISLSDNPWNFKTLIRARTTRGRQRCNRQGIFAGFGMPQYNRSISDSKYKKLQEYIINLYVTFFPYRCTMYHFTRERIYQLSHLLSLMSDVLGSFLICVGG